MPNPLAEDARALSDEELGEAINEAYREMFNLQFQRGARQLQNPMAIRAARRHIARLRTIYRQRQQGADLGRPVAPLARPTAPAVPPPTENMPAEDAPTEDAPPAAEEQVAEDAAPVEDAPTAETETDAGQEPTAEIEAEDPQTTDDAEPTDAPTSQSKDD